MTVYEFGVIGIYVSPASACSAGEKVVGNEPVFPTHVDSTGGTDNLSSTVLIRDLEHRELTQDHFSWHSFSVLSVITALFVQGTRCRIKRLRSDNCAQLQRTNVTGCR